ncbi:MAG: hypothetical protein KME10_27685 [Plectolyngbya sp. WJT66-NPBG17]|jgi:hypothetical protein|nr:hypothetical protein [Plectolyngbya sp. WJT66-NPBG17]
MTFSLQNYADLLRSDLSRRSKGILNAQTVARAAFDGTAEEIAVMMVAHNLLRDLGRLNQQYVCYTVKIPQQATYFFHARQNELTINKAISSDTNRQQRVLSAVYVPNIRTLRVKSSHLAEQDLKLFGELSIQFLLWTHQVKFQSRISADSLAFQESSVMTPQYRGGAFANG